MVMKMMLITLTLMLMIITITVIYCFYSIPSKSIASLFPYEPTQLL